MKKRMISLLLVLCMVLSAFSTAIPAFAEEETPICGEYLLYMDEPKVGASLAQTVKLPTGAPFNATVYWEYYGPEGAYLPASGGAAGNKAYRATIELTPKSGYHFEDITLFLNDFAADVMDFGPNLIIMMERYDLRKEITDINVTNVADAEFGKPIPTAMPKVAADAPYTLKSYEWYGDEDTPLSGTFGKEDYRYVITLIPKEGYVFAKDRNVYVNGNYRHDSYFGSFDSLCIEDYYYFSEDLDEVSVSNVPTATIGGTATSGTATVPNGANYTAEYYWLTEDYNRFEGTFEDGQKYIRRIDITPAEGYYPYVNKFILNGQEVDPQDYCFDSNLLWLETTFSFKKTISKVEVPDTNAVVGTVVSQPGGSIPDGANYYATGGYFQDYDYIHIDYPFTFQNGTVYYYNNHLYPNEGYEFAEDLQVYLNGQLIEANDYSYNYLNLNYRYSFMNTIDKVELPALPNAKAGEKAVYGKITSPAGAHYDIIGRWYYSDEYTTREFIGTFSKKGAYEYHLTALPHDGYEFAEDTAIYIGGKKYNGEAEDYFEHISIFGYSSVGYDMITELNLSADKPVINEEYDYETIKTDETNYLIEYAVWYSNDKDEFSYDCYTEEFVENNYCWLEIGLLAKSGNRFSNEMTIRINGRPVTPTKVENWGSPFAYFVIPFGKLTKAPELKDSTAAFSDLKKGQWYQEYTNYVYTTGLMEGVGNGKFAPSTTMTRAMFVTVLARMAGIDTKANNVQAGFNDVKSGQWYAAAVKWASENKIVNGVGDGKFDPNAQIKRQDICVMLLRYANVLDVKLQKNAAKATFADDKKIQSYATDAVYTCQQAAIVNGKPGNQFDPRGFATRAEVSKMLSIFHKDYIA